ncbi:MAG: hypothetical protein IPM24_04360 [Bryobacterales bacterium]|nr:hypothetical protein [Bryobacterales bacterium]
MLTELAPFMKGLLSFLGIILGVLAVVAVAAMLWLAVLVFRTWRQQRGMRVITCPENHKTAAVEVSVPHLIKTKLQGAPEFRLSQCSRWPEKAGCGQECLRQIETQAGGCLVHNTLAEWYRGKTCIICQVPLDPEEWSVHKPALCTPEGGAVSWDEIPVEAIPAVLESHQPLCWNCHIAVKLRSRHPDLVADRPWPVTGPCGERSGDEEVQKV